MTGGAAVDLKNIWPRSRTSKLSTLQRLLPVNSEDKTWSISHGQMNRPRWKDSMRSISRREATGKDIVDVAVDVRECPEKWGSLECTIVNSACVAYRTKYTTVLIQAQMRPLPTSGAKSRPGLGCCEGWLMAGVRVAERVAVWRCWGVDPHKLPWLQAAKFSSWGLVSQIDRAPHTMPSQQKKQNNLNSWARVWTNGSTPSALSSSYFWHPALCKDKTLENGPDHVIWMATMSINFSNQINRRWANKAFRRCFRSPLPPHSLHWPTSPTGNEALAKNYSSLGRWLDSVCDVQLDEPNTASWLIIMAAQTLSRTVHQPKSAHCCTSPKPMIEYPPSAGSRN